MDPNYQPQQPGQQPTQQFPQPAPQGVDYLNSIAAPTKTKTVNPLVLWGLIAGVLITVILFVVGLSGAGSTTDQLALVGASSSELKSLSEKANNDIQSSELRSINSSLTLVLTNTNRELATALKNEEINLKDKKKNKTVAAVVAGYEEINQRLEDAKLNAVYDRTYVREVNYLLKTLHADMEELFNSSRSKSLKTALETSDNSLAPLRESLESFQAE